MIGVNFDKMRSEHFLGCLANGGPIEHSGPWSVDDMTALAGACFFIVSTHGPWIRRFAAAMGNEVPEPHAELKEARDETLFADLHGAIEYLAKLSMRVVDKEYDDAYEPQVSLLLDGAARSIKPLRGFKTHTSE